MKRNLKRFLSISLILLIAFSIFLLTQNHVDHNTLRIEGFYQEEKNTLDVVFIGASDVFTGYSAGLAYGEYGFTSYPYAIDANNISMFKSQINEVLNYQSPKCIVIETTGAMATFSEVLDDEQLAIMRQYTDVMPLSSNKILTIDEFVQKDKLSYYIPAIAHHGRINNFRNSITKYSQALRGYTYLKGVTSTNKRQEYEKILDVNNDYNTMNLSEKAYSALCDLLDFCESLNCKVIFIRFPHRITTETEYVELKQQNEIGRIISKRGFDFINLDHKISEIGLDMTNDYYSDSHLNVHGQVKNTRYISRIIAEQYGIKESMLSQQNFERWNKSYKYTELFYQYYDLHKNDEQEHWWYENPELIRELEKLEEQSRI